MSDGAHRKLTEEERDHALRARRSGGRCAACGRGLLDGEPVWIERFMVDVAYGGRARWWLPVGAECASAPFRAATEAAEPERCTGCGRGVYYRSGAGGRRRRALCSRACGRPGATPPARPGRRAEPPMASVTVAGEGEPPWVR